MNGVFLKQSEEKDGLGEKQLVFLNREQAATRKLKQGWVEKLENCRWQRFALPSAIFNSTRCGSRIL
jgi:hypothetical protein